MFSFVISGCLPTPHRYVREVGDQEKGEVGRGRRRESLLFGQTSRIHSPSTCPGSV